MSRPHSYQSICIFNVGQTARVKSIWGNVGHTKSAVHDIQAPFEKAQASD